MDEGREVCGEVWGLSRSGRAIDRRCSGGVEAPTSRAEHARVEGIYARALGMAGWTCSCAALISASSVTLPARRHDVNEKLRQEREKAYGGVGAHPVFRAYVNIEVDGEALCSESIQRELSKVER